MQESNFENFNHLKIHSQFSICEGAIKLDDLKDISKENKLKAIGLCDTSNLCGALEFAEKLSKSGSQPIIGTQINFKFNNILGLLPLFALDENGYKTIIKLQKLYGHLVTCDCFVCLLCGFRFRGSPTFCVLLS